MRRERHIKERICCKCAGEKWGQWGNLSGSTFLPNHVRDFPEGPQMAGDKVST